MEQQDLKNFYTRHCHASFFKFQQPCRPLSRCGHSAPSRQRITHAWPKSTFRWLRLKILELIPSFSYSWCSDAQEHMPFVQSIRLDFVWSHETGCTPLPSVDDIASASLMPSILLDVLIDVLKSLWVCRQYRNLIFSLRINVYLGPNNIQQSEHSPIRTTQKKVFSYQNTGWKSQMV